MTKQTKMILGVGAVALVGYFVWKGMKPKTTNASGSGCKVCDKACAKYSSTRTWIQRLLGRPSDNQNCHNLCMEEGGCPDVFIINNL